MNRAHAMIELKQRQSFFARQARAWRPLLLALLMTMWSGVTRADMLVDFRGGGGPANFSSDVTVGWQFELSSPIAIDGLAFLDRGGRDEVEVGLWNSDGSVLLSSAKIRRDTSFREASISGLADWVYRPMDTMVLSPGRYVLGVWLSSHDVWHYGGTVSTAPGVTSVAARGVSGTGLRFPDGSWDVFNPGVWGPNLHLSPNSVVPEPSSLTLCGIGLAGAVVSWLRRRRAVVVCAGDPRGRSHRPHGEYSVAAGRAE